VSAQYCTSSCAAISSHIERPRLSRIFYGGKYYSYPLNAFEALANLGIVRSAACMLSFAYAKARPIKDARTFHQWVRNQFGEKLFSIFFKTYTEKVWGLSCDEISADWAAQRIKGLDLGVAVWSALKRAILPNRAATAKPGEPVVKSLIESFRYPRKGPGMMWDAAARKVIERGGQVLMGRGLTKLACDAATGLWTISVATTDGHTETYTARHVVSSAPVRELTEKLSPSPMSRLHARIALPRFPHRRPDGQQARFVSRQLDLHPRSVREGRPGAEFPLMVARTGAARHVLPRPRIFLLRRRRPVERQRCRPHRTRQAGDRQDRLDPGHRCGRRLRGAPTESLSGL
jgi:hypothetical protein